jgi:hypothetical protein
MGSQERSNRLILLSQLSQNAILHKGYTLWNRANSFLLLCDSWNFNHNVDSGPQILRMFWWLGPVSFSSQIGAYYTIQKVHFHWSSPFCWPSPSNHRLLNPIPHPLNHLLIPEPLISIKSLHFHVPLCKRWWGRISSIH